MFQRSRHRRERSDNCLHAKVGFASRKDPAPHRDTAQGLRGLADPAAPVSGRPAHDVGFTRWRSPWNTLRQPTNLLYHPVVSEAVGQELGQHKARDHCNSPIAQAAVAEKTQGIWGLSWLGRRHLTVFEGKLWLYEKLPRSTNAGLTDREFVPQHSS